MCNGYDLTHGILVREIGMRQNAVDDDHGLGLGGVRWGEKTASMWWDFHCLKVFRTRLEVERMCRVLYGGGLLRADPEGAAAVLLTPSKLTDFQPYGWAEGPCESQRNNIGKIHCLYAGIMANAH